VKASEPRPKYFNSSDCKKQDCLSLEKHKRKVNVNGPHDTPGQAQGGGGGIAPPNSNPALEGGGLSESRSGRFTSRE
jgi:hypothetical protein